MNITATDRATIRSAIQCQLEAFQRDDAFHAFSFACPEIQVQFGTPENFMTMVKIAYQPVYRPRSVLFEELTLMQGVPTQPVLLLGPDDRLVRALYPVQKQVDGTWKIAGCFLVPLEGECS